MALVRLCGRRENWRLNSVAISHTRGQWDTTNFASLQIVLVTAAGQVSPNDAFNRDDLTFTADHDSALEQLTLFICQPVDA